MSQQFKDLPLAKQQELIAGINDLLVENGLEDFVKPEHKLTQLCKLAFDDEAVPVGSLQVIGKAPFAKQDAVKKFKESANTLLDGVEGVYCNPESRVLPGDLYQKITGVVPLDKTEPVELAYTDGQVWLLYIWACWHPRCETYMDKFEEMLTKNGDEWGSNVRIIAVNVDKEKEQAISFVQSKGYSKIEQYHNDSSECSDLYMGLRDVPFGVFINKEGKVVQKGHPQERDLDKDFADLLSGQALTGDGVADPPFQFPAHFKKLDVDTVLSEMAAFTELAKELQASEIIKENIKPFVGLMKAECTLSLTTIYDPKSKESMSHYVCEKALMGKTVNMEPVKAILDEKVKGSFEDKPSLTELNI